MSCLVAGNADCSSGGIVINILRKTDHIGSGVIMVCQLPADPFNPHALYAVVAQNPLGSLRSGDSSDRHLLRILAESGIDVAAGPQ